MKTDWIPTDLLQLKEYYAMCQGILGEMQGAGLDKKFVLTGVDKNLRPDRNAKGRLNLNNAKFVEASIKIAEKLRKLMGEEAFTQWTTRYAAATPSEREAMWKNGGEWDK